MQDVEKSLPCVLWLELWYSSLNDIHVITVQLHDACRCGVGIKARTIPSPHTRFECFLTLRFEAREVRNYYCGTSAYDHLGGQHEDSKVYGHAIMSLSSEKLLISLIGLMNKINNTDGERDVWTIPTEMQYNVFHELLKMTSVWCETL